MPEKAIKYQALVGHPVPHNWELSDDLLGKEVFCVDVLPPWKMYFDDDARHDGAGAGVVLVSREKHILPYSFTLT